MNKIYRIRKSIKLFHNKNKVKIIFMNRYKELTLECNEVGKYILKLLADKICENDLISSVVKRYSSTKKDNIKIFLKKLYDLQIIDLVKNDKYEKSIVSRQVNFYDDISSDSLKMQDELGKKNVLILGLGGVGSCISYFLAQSGIKHFILVDKDKVEITNLGRQALYFNQDIGKYKVDVVYDRLKKLNSEIEIKKYKLSINNEMDFIQINQIPNIVVNCLDEPSTYLTGKWVSNYYLKLDVPVINGIGYRGNIISLGLTTIPRKTICWNCAYSEYEKEIEGYTPFLVKEREPQAGVTSPLANFIGSIHSQEIINVLSSELKPILINRIGLINFTTLSVQWEKLHFYSHPCPVCKYIKESDKKYD
jgi:molybdopterin-synthase adenylyltransferase